MAAKLSFEIQNRRYIDDTFLLFHHPSHVDQFFNYLNDKHPNITFTKEIESNGTLSFLDIKISKSDNFFQTSVFRKSTFTGLSMNFHSFCSHNFKSAVIRNYLHRAYIVCSSYILLDREFSFIRGFLMDNGYLSKSIYSRIRRFLDEKFLPGKIIDPSSTPDCNYIKLPYFGYKSEKMRSELHSFLNSITSVNYKIILVNNFKISNIFNYKDILPKAAQSSVVYKYSCAQCASAYVGSTTRSLQSRVREHAGRSIRTNQPLSSPNQSSIRDHSDRCGSDIELDSFQILRKNSDPIDLRIIESLFIYALNPKLNSTTSWFPLKFF